MKKLFIKTIFICSLILTSCSNNPPEIREKTPEELRIDLKRKELEQPLKYIVANNFTLETLRKKVKNATLFRDAKYKDDGAQIQGAILNKATLAKFKDIVLEISYYSQTETLINKETLILYEYYEPNSTNSISLKVNPPKAYKSFGLRIIKATGVR